MTDNTDILDEIKLLKIKRGIFRLENQNAKTKKLKPNEIVVAIKRLIIDTVKS